MWLPIGLMVLLAGLTFWLNYAVQVKSPAAAKPVRHEPDAMGEDVAAHQLGVEGNLRYTLVAKKMVHYPDDDTTHMQGVTFSDFEKDQPPLTVRSDRARIIGRGNEIFFNGHVVLIREPFAGRQRMTMHTEYFHVVPDAGTGDTDREVLIEEGANVITASSLRLNRKTRLAQLTNAKALYYLSSQ
jgi:lipopolysaccharide export system protein LptC